MNDEKKNEREKHVRIQVYMQSSFLCRSVSIYAHTRTVGVHVCDEFA